MPLNNLLNFEVLQTYMAGNGQWPVANWPSAGQMVKGGPVTFGDSLPRSAYTHGDDPKGRKTAASSFPPFRWSTFRVRIEPD